MMKKLFKKLGQKNKSRATSPFHDPAPPDPSFGLEPLEPRLLLSADMTFAAAAGQMLDLTLRTEDDGVNTTIQLLDNTDQSIVAEQLLADTSDIVITGADQDDRLVIDASQALGVPITFDGADGSDTLEVINGSIDSVVNDESSATLSTGDVVSLKNSSVEDIGVGPINIDLQNIAMSASDDLIEDVWGGGTRFDNWLDNYSRFISFDESRFDDGDSAEEVPIDFYADVADGTSSVTFSLGAWQVDGIYDVGTNTWVGHFNDMSEVSSTVSELVVTADSYSEAYDINIFELPEWFYNEAGTTYLAEGAAGEFLKYGETDFQVTHSWDGGYVFDVTYDILFAGFELPDNSVWNLEVPAIGEIINLRAARTGITAYTGFQLTSRPDGTVSDSEVDHDVGVKFEVFNYEIFNSGDEEFRFDFSGAVEIESNDDLQLDSIQTNLNLSVEQFVEWKQKLFEARVPLLSVPRLADFVLEVFFELGIGESTTSESLLSSIFTLYPDAEDKFEFQKFDFGVGLSGVLEGNAGLDALLGLGELKANLAGSLKQDFLISYDFENQDQPWRLSSPGSFSFDIGGVWDTLWGFGPGGSFDLFSFDAGHWDFFAGNSGQPNLQASFDNLGKSVYLFSNMKKMYDESAKTLTLQVDWIHENISLEPEKILANIQYGKQTHSVEYETDGLKYDNDRRVYTWTIKNVDLEDITDISFTATTWENFQGNYYYAPYAPVANINWVDESGNILPNEFEVLAGDIVYIEFETVESRIGKTVPLFLYDCNGDGFFNAPTDIKPVILEIPGLNDEDFGDHVMISNESFPDSAAENKIIVRIPWVVQWFDVDGPNEKTPGVELYVSATREKKITSTEFLTVANPILSWTDAQYNEITEAVDEGTAVYVTLSNVNFNPDTTQIVIEIYEDDILGDEIIPNCILLQPEEHNGEVIWRQVWTSEYRKDTVGLPDFKFRITKKGTIIDGISYRDVGETNDGRQLKDLAGLKSPTLNVREVIYSGELIHEGSVDNPTPLVLVHGNGSENRGDFAAWDTFNSYIENNPSQFEEFDVYVWKHSTSLPVGYYDSEGAGISQADLLEQYIYDELGVGITESGEYEDNQVLLVAHSQGGLVARAFMERQNALADGFNGDDVLGLITLATPHLGSPLAVPDWFVQVWGETFGYSEASLAGFFSIVRQGGLFDPTLKGSVNLAWDDSDNNNFDDIYTVFGIDNVFFGDLSVQFELTTNDLNTPNISLEDFSEFYQADLKDDHGTLFDINDEARFLDKIIAFAAFDDDLWDNPLGDLSISSLFNIDSAKNHVGLEMLTLLMAGMQTNSGGNFYANDGMVPLQSALFLDLEDEVQFASLGDKFSVVLDPQALQNASRVLRTHIFTENAHGIADHLDLLDTDNDGYWKILTAEVRSFLTGQNPNPGPELDVDIASLKQQALLEFKRDQKIYLDEKYGVGEWRWDGDISLTNIRTYVEHLGGEQGNETLREKIKYDYTYDFEYSYEEKVLVGSFFKFYRTVTVWESSTNSGADTYTPNPDGVSGKTHVDVTGTSDVDKVYFVGVQSTAHIETYGQNDIIDLGNDTTGAAVIHGGSGADQITGGAGNDTIFGDDGNDIIKGEGGIDTLYGDDGSTVLSGTAQLSSLAITGTDNNDIIIGGADEDYIYGEEGNDILIGDDGSFDGDSAEASSSGSKDYIYGQSGKDKILGGGGGDYLYGDENPNGTESGSDRDIILGDGGTITYTDKFDFNAVTGITSTPSTGGSDNIWGNDGDDIIYGGGSGDNLYGQVGDDEIHGDDGDDYLYGSVGGDTLIGNAGSDHIYGQENDDILIGDNGSVADGSVTADDNGSTDYIYGLEGNDIILGGGGADFLYGDNKEDGSSIGNWGSDVILGDGGTVNISTGAVSGSNSGDSDDDDWIEGNEGNDRVYGGRGEDEIYGHEGIDRLHGDDGNDVIFGNEHNDYIYGDAGTDVIFGDNASITEMPSGDVGPKWDDEGGSGDDEIHGGDDRDWIYGQRGNDTVWGDGGNDVIEGNQDNDIIYGNAGNDLIYGQGGNDILIGDDGDASGSPIIANANDTTDGVDTIYGQAGDDKILGGGKGDFLYGDINPDGTSAGSGKDIIIGDGGQINYSGSKFDYDDVTKVEALSISGGNDSIEGNDGTDIALGGAADDTIYGQAGNDILLGDNGTIDMSASKIESGVNDNDGKDTIYGQGGDDKILGGGEGDFLYGDKNPDGTGTGSNSDIIIGDGGKITFAGDRFAFDQVTEITNTSLTPEEYGKDGGDDALEGNAGDDIVLGGAGGDTSNAVDPGNDMILGDNGTVKLSNGKLVTVDTANENVGGADTVKGGADNDIIIGGGSADEIEGNDSQDIILGDNGIVAFNEDEGEVDLTTVDRVESALDGIGGDDTLSGNEDADIIIGGYGGDDIYGDNAGADSGEDEGDILLGDNGRVLLRGKVPGDFVTFNSAVEEVVTTDTMEASGGGDTIKGNTGNDIIIGGINNGEADTLSGNDGNDILVGDNGLVDFAHDNDDNLSTLDRIVSGTWDETAEDIIPQGHGGVDNISGDAGDDVVIGGTAGDRIYGDDENASAGSSDGEDVLLGDNGEILLSAETVSPGRLTILGDNVQKIQTTDTENTTGGADIIEGNAGGDVILGGVNGDPVNAEPNEGDKLYGDRGSPTPESTTNDGNDVILGDNGYLDFDAGDGNLATLDRVASDLDALGGADHISGNAGNDVAIGGTAGDIIHGDDANAMAGAADGRDILLGDNAQIDLNGVVGEMHILGSAVEKISTTDTEERTGGSDTIEGNAGSDVILGGVQGDTLYGDAASLGSDDGDDVILGDNGELDFDTDDTGDLTTLDTVKSNLDALGGVDNISGNAGNDIAIGGTAGDTIHGDDATASARAADGRDILLGDNAQIDLNGKTGQMKVLGSAIETIQTTDDTTATGGSDTIEGNADVDTILGGVMGDTLHGDAASVADYDGDDVILGDNGRLEWGYQGDGGAIESGMVFDNTLETLDLITTELPDAQPGGRDEVYGDEGSDVIFGGTDSDLLYGDDGNATGSVDNNDVMFGDHGRLYPQHSSLVGFNSNNFFAIDTGDKDGGEGDRMYGEVGDDVMLGQQGDDRMWGGSGHDDMVGGHNVSGGIDELSDPAVSAEVNPEINDIMDGGSGDDVMAGDNAVIWRITDPESPRFHALDGTLMYKVYDNSKSEEVQTDYTFDEYGKPNVTGTSQNEPGATVGRTVELLNHDADTSPDNDGFSVFGDDYIAGNADDDVLFGQLGNDVLQGDGSIDTAEDTGAVASETINVTDAGEPDSGETLYFNIDEAASDGDDYIEGNGGSELIFGNLGQDDIIGGSSSLFGLMDADDRPDAGDVIFGGASNRVTRNEFLTLANNGDIELRDSHSRDSDMIVGDNGNIYRLVDNSGYLEFSYDRSTDSFGDRGTLKIVPRAVELLDYIPGIGDTLEDGVAHGAADLIHGESGDDFIHGMMGDDILYGDSEDDDLYGEAGNDWISGGTGDDGVLGDDGLIFTSRNTARDNRQDESLSESLYGIDKLDEVDLLIATPGNIQQSVINIDEMLRKSVDLTPFSLGGDDIIYGGLGNDFLHGGAGDDAMSGAEALEESAVLWFDEADGSRNPDRTDRTVINIDYYNPSNPGNVLGFEAYKGDEFAYYDEYNPLHKIMVDDSGLLKDFLLNFEAFESADDQIGSKIDDGNDVLFGDIGNDWLVGGTGQDRLYGGYGADLLNADDNHNTVANNEVPDHAAFSGVTAAVPSVGADIAHGGAGRDILIGNTGADRLIDWVGEYNSYVVPYAPYGQFSVSRSLQPQLRDYLYDLSESDGADQSRSYDTGTDADRNGEPEGELGIVLQQDPDWKDQTGAPDDPQAGNIPGGKRDVMEASDFNFGTSELFAVESGAWDVSRGQYIGQAAKTGEAISLFYVNDQLPSYYEMLATIKANKDMMGYKSNGYIIFDYYSETDFKFAGIDVSTDKLQIGQRTANGWVVETQSNMRLKYGINYNMMVAVNGTNVTLVVNNENTVSHTFAPRILDGYSVGLNTGMLGIGTNNAISRFDNVVVQKLPPVFTEGIAEDFSDGRADGFNEVSGSWTAADTSYRADASGIAISTFSLDNSLSSFIEFESSVATDSFGGLIFDYYSETDYKFVSILPDSGQVVIGHATEKGLVYDVIEDLEISSGVDYTLGLSLHGNSVSVTLDSQVVAGYAYNSLLVDGDIGLFSVDADSIFDDLLIRYQR